MSLDIGRQWALRRLILSETLDRKIPTCAQSFRMVLQGMVADNAPHPHLVINGWS